MENTLEQIEGRIADAVDRYQEAVKKNTDQNVLKNLQSNVDYLREIREKLLNQ